MPALSNPKHERFASNLAKGKTADEAYVLAGFKANRGNATRLKANESVQKRVRELAGKASQRAEWSAADRLRMLHDIAMKAFEDDRRTAIAAIAEANKMQGSHAPAQHRHTGPNGGPIQTVDLTNATDEQLDTLEGIFGPLAGSGHDDEVDQGGEGEEEAAG